MLQPADIVDPNSGQTAWDLAMRPCRTKEELKNWLYIFLNMDLPDTIVDPDSTSNPMDMAWRVYSNCLWWNELPVEQRSQKMLFYASRQAFKTYVAAAIEFAVILHDTRGVVHCASTEDQAKKCYEDYFGKFLKMSFWKPLTDALPKSNATETIFPNGVKLKIIPVTRRAVQGQHESLLTRDEIDVVQDITAYKDLDPIPINMPDKRPPVDFGISVRKSAFGLVQREIDAAARGEKDVKVFHWNIIDVTERCPDSRSGTKPVKLYVLNDSMHYVNQEDYRKLDPGDRRRYTEHQALEGCYTNCKLFAACLTNLKRQESQCSWLKTIDYTQGELRKTSEDVFIASYLSRKPPAAGLTYTRFDDKNVKTYAEMYEIFTGDKWPKPTMSLEDFIAVMKQHNIPAVAGVDWGFTHPSVCVVGYIDRSDNFYIVYCMSQTGVDDAEFVRMIKDQIQPRFNVQLYFPDTENPSAIKMMISKHDLPVSRADKRPGSVYDGVQVVKSFITAPGTNTAKLFVAKDSRSGCDFVTYEFSKYHHKIDAGGRIIDDEFADEDDHSMDAIRYILFKVYGGRRAELTVSRSSDPRVDAAGKPITDEVPVKDVEGNFTRAPSAAEFAAHIGLVGFVDNREEKKEKDEAESAPGGIGGMAGGFTFSFGK